MSTKTQYTDSLEISQHELIENAQRRIRQKKLLYLHFILFLVGSLFLVIFNKVLNYYPETNWSVWAMTVWALLVCIHAIKVFFINKFLGQEWERTQRDRLIKIQKKRIAKLQEEVDKEYPLIPKTETK